MTATAPSPGFEPESGTHDALAAGLEALGLPSGPLEPMAVKGVAHRHWRVGGHGLVVRVPLVITAGVSAADQIRREAAGFQRGAVSGAVPALHGVIAPSPALPTGALVVTDIIGRPPRLPADLPALARALAALHALALPKPAARLPLPAPADPARALLALVETQAGGLPAAGLSRELVATLELELALARGWVDQVAPALPPPLALIGADTHPGNFLIDDAGAAWFVDLERAEYGVPAVDLAHATLPTSTTWDGDCAAVVSEAETQAFYRTWADAVPAALATAVRPWLGPVRRLIWLRTLTWMVRWRGPDAPALLARLPPERQRQVLARVEDSLTARRITEMRTCLHWPVEPAMTPATEPPP